MEISNSVIIDKYLPSQGGGLKDLYYKVTYISKQTERGESLAGTLTISLCLKTKSGYILLGIAKEFECTGLGRSESEMNYDGHTFNWQGYVYNPYATFYIDGKYVGLLRRTYYIKYE